MSRHSHTAREKARGEDGQTHRRHLKRSNDHRWYTKNAPSCTPSVRPSVGRSVGHPSIHQSINQRVREMKEGEGRTRAERKDQTRVTAGVKCDMACAR